MSVLRGGAQLGAAIWNVAAAAWRAHWRLPEPQRRAFRRDVADGTARALRQLQTDLQGSVDAAAGVFHPVMQRLREEARGLHRLLPPADYSYSVIILAGEEGPAGVRASIKACKALSAPRMELLVGIAPPQDRLSVIQAVGDDVRIVTVDAPEALFPSLVTAARGSHLLFVTGGDWVRPDMLYRYELVLRAQRNSSATIVACAAQRLGTLGELFGPPTTVPSQPHPPLIFCTEAFASGVLVPRRIAASTVESGEPFTVINLVLGAMSAGADYVHVPIALRAVPRAQQPPVANAHALRRYFQSAGLDWRVQDDRIIPGTCAPASVHAVVLYRDYRDLTLECIESLRAQRYPALAVTAVDNGSTDHSIAATLSAGNIDVVRIDEPFNFSRLANLAACRAASELLLFLNNDVTLMPGTLFELAAWAVQPPVGLVGPALYLPDGRLQHGGIERSIAASAGGMWEEVEYGWQRRDLVRAARLRIVDAVSGACAMTRRAVFDSVGGFDEVNYPVAFSDTDLAQRIAGRGLACVYTPHAEGIHHESTSRHFERLENFEGSAWFAQQLGRW